MQTWRRLLCVALASVALSCAGQVRVAGSDLLGPEFSKTLYSVAQREGWKFSIALDGSRPGLDTLKSQRTDLALVLVAANEVRERVREFEATTIAYQCVFVVAPADVPIPHVTLAQLARIFGATGPAIRTWSELGVMGDRARESFAAYAPEVGFSFSAEFFRHVVLADAPLKPSVRRFRSAQELTALFREGPGLALTADLPSDAQFRALPILAEKEGEAVTPSAASLRDGKYPLAIPLQLVTRRDASGEAKAVVEWLQSEAATPVFAREKFVPARP